MLEYLGAPALEHSGNPCALKQGFSGMLERLGGSSTLKQGPTSMLGHLGSSSMPESARVCPSTLAARACSSVRALGCLASSMLVNTNGGMRTACHHKAAIGQEAPSLGAYSPCIAQYFWKFRCHPALLFHLCRYIELALKPRCCTKPHCT